MELPELPMMHILSYLDAFSLLQISQVNKTWNKAADSDLLWRKICLKKWYFCKLIPQLQDAQTWKEFFIYQTRQECQMAMTKPEDFIYKEVSVQLGIVFKMSYLSENGLTVVEQKKSVICVASSCRTISTWDVQEGTMIWSSPVQTEKLCIMVTFPQLHLAITEDLGKNLKVWNCRDENAVATCTMPYLSCSMAPFLTKDGAFMVIGDYGGMVSMVTMPDLELLSTVSAFEWDVRYLQCSPENKWVIAYRTHPHVLPKVFFMESLLKPAKYGSPLHVSISFPSCSRACWTPRRENRITLMYVRGPRKITGFITIDLMAVEMPGGQMHIRELPVANFLLPSQIAAPKCLAVSPESVIVFRSENKLFVFSMHGSPLHQFEDHQANIRDLKLNFPHVLAILMDDSLHMYMWDEERRSPYLRSCFGLTHRREHRTKECQLMDVISDNKSIVCIWTTVDHLTIFKIYTLKR